MMRYTVFLGAALCIAATPAAAQDIQDSRDNAVAEVGSPADGEIRVTAEVEEEQIERCRYVQITGTRFRERICMTQEEMAQQVANTREVSEDVRNAGAPQFQDDIIDNLPVAPGT